MIDYKDVERLTSLQQHDDVIHRWEPEITEVSHERPEGHPRPNPVSNPDHAYVLVGSNREPSQPFRDPGGHEIRPVYLGGRFMANVSQAVERYAEPVLSRLVLGVTCLNGQRGEHIRQVWHGQYFNHRGGRSTRRRLYISLHV